MKSKTTTIRRTLKALAITAFCFNFGALSPTAPMLGATARAQESKTQILQKIRPIVDRANAKQALYQANGAKYDSAIRNISALEQAPLKTADDVKRAIDVLQKSELDDAMVFGKGFTLAINVSSFKAGVRAQADRLTAKSVATQIKNKSLSLSSVGGFNDLKSTIKRQFDGDAAMLKRVGARLQQASKQKGISFSSPSSAPKTGMAFAAAPGLMGEKAAPNSFTSFINYHLTPAPAPVETENAASTQIDPITASLLLGIALGAAGYIITQYALEKAQDTEENSETGVSQLGECRADAKKTRNSCLAKHDKDFFGQAGCWGQYAIDEAACLLLPL